eukprot:gene16643-22893_t
MDQLQPESGAIFATLNTFIHALLITGSDSAVHATWVLAVALTLMHERGEDGQKKATSQGSSLHPKDLDHRVHIERVLRLHATMLPGCRR